MVHIFLFLVAASLVGVAIYLLLKTLDVDRGRVRAPARDVVERPPSAGKGLVVPLPVAVLVPAAFFVDVTFGLVATILALACALKGKVAASSPARSPAAGSNVAFEEWKRGEEDRIAAMRAALDETQAEFETHLREQREAEDRREFEAFRQARNRDREGV